MSMKDLEIAMDLIGQNGGDFEGKKEDDLIFKAEQILGLTFPATYKKFLSQLGCGDINGLEFYGIISDNFQNSNIPDAVWLTLEERKSGLPDYLILIYAVGDGTYYALDASKADFLGEYPVIAYRIDASSTKIADDYGSFLLSELKTVL